MYCSNRSRSFLLVFVLLLTVLIFPSLSVANTYLDCFYCSRSQCPSIAKQESPGVGISLAFDHITVAVQFRNGTLLDAAHVDASDDYLHTITQLHWLMHPSHVSRLEAQIEQTSRPHPSPQGFITSIRQYLGSARKGMPLPKSEFESPQTVLQLMTTNTLVLANTTRSIFDQIATNHSVQEPYVHISLPQALQRSDIVAYHMRKLWLNAAALKPTQHSCMSEINFHSHSRSYLAWIETYGLYGCYDELHGDICDFSMDDPTIWHLGVELSDKYFAIDIMARGWRMVGFNHTLVRSHPNQGASLAGLSEDSGYWKWLQEQMQQLLADTGIKIDSVGLHGTRVTDSALRQVLGDVFKNSSDVLPPMKEDDDHIFAAARYAARAAKMAMWFGGTGCVPNCQDPPSKFMPKSLQWRTRDKFLKSEI